MQTTMDDFVVIKKRVSPVQGRGAWTQGAGRIHDQGVEGVQTVSYIPMKCLNITAISYTAFLMTIYLFSVIQGNNFLKKWWCFSF